MRTLQALLTSLVILAACTDEGPASFGDPIDLAQTPPRGKDDILTWIEAGHYLAWHCEVEAHPGRSPSPHGLNRICSNDLLSASEGTGSYPVGAAALKEILDGSGKIKNYAVYRKVTEGAGGDTWYWFEGTRNGVAANGEGDGTCTGCHSHAPRDFVFTRI